MELKWLSLESTKVTDISPLRQMPLEHLDIRKTSIDNKEAIKTLPLTDLFGDFNKTHVNLLRSIPTLTTINQKPAGEFFDKYAQIKVAKPQWSEPVNLGSVINSTAKEAKQITGQAV